MNSDVSISICIVTYRRPKGLARLLDSLLRLKIPTDVVVETIVVDNDAKRSAAPVVRAQPAELQPRYFVEPVQNIAIARNRALAEARGRWLMFIDDDEVADENWLNAYLELLEWAQCDGAFGPVFPKLETVETPWLDLETFYSGPRHPTGTTLSTSDLWTSNAILRRALFAEKKFDPAYGRSGGEDADLFGRLAAAGARFLWCDEARVVEHLPPERHRLGWLARRAVGGGCVHTRIHGMQTLSDSAVSAARASALLCAFAALLPLAALGGRRSAAKRWLRVCTQAGHLWALSGFSFEPYRPSRERREGDTRIAILTNAPAPYRAPVFEQISAAPNVDALVVFDGASDASVTDDETNYPHETIAPLFGFRLPSYQDNDDFAEHVATRFALGYLQKLRSFRPNVIISGEFGWRTINAAVYAFCARIPLLIWWEGSRFTERKVSRFRTALRKNLARVSAGLLGFGRVSVEYLEEITDSSEKLFFIPQTVDNDKIALATEHWRANREQLRAQLGLRGVVLLCLGSWLPRKGIASYLDALRRLEAAVPEGSFTAVFAGEGPERERLQTAETELGGALRVLGKFSPEEIPQLFAASDVLVFPTLRDCWGMVVNEALAAGIPVLGSRYAGAAEELLAEGDVGTLIDPLDPKSLDAALLAAVRDRKGLDEPPARFQRALAGYSSQQAADAILRAVKRVL